MPPETTVSGICYSWQVKTWNAAEHPRDAVGKFVRVGSLVDLPGTGGVGQVIGTGKGSTVQVRTASGVQQVRADQTTVIDPPRTDAHTIADLAHDHAPTFTAADPATVTDRHLVEQLRRSGWGQHAPVTYDADTALTFGDWAQAAQVAGLDTIPAIDIADVASRYGKKWGAWKKDHGDQSFPAALALLDTVPTDVAHTLGMNEMPLVVLRKLGLNLAPYAITRQMEVSTLPPLTIMGLLRATLPSNTIRDLRLDLLRSPGG